MKLARVVGAVAAVALLAGCGSTVAPVVTGQAASVGADGLSAPQSTTAHDTAPTSGSGDALSGVGAAPSGHISPAPASSGVASAPIASGQPGQRISTATAANGPGVTASTITIGVTYYQSAEAANAALGAKGVDTGDPVAATHVLINWINNNGGIAGRKVVPLLYGVDPQSATPYATEAQAECTYFTEDHKVLAVIDGTPALDARECFDKRGVADFRGPLLTSGLSANEIDAYTSRLDRAFSAMVPALSRAGWFSGWNRVTAQPGTLHAKTGIVTADSPEDNRAVDQVLIPALRAAGYAPDPADVIRITPPGGFSDDGATVAAIDNAVLKLNADGVTHVILNDGNGSLSLLFNNYAYSQGYFPRYGGTTGNGWQVLLSAGDIQAKTLHGAMGIGWQPLFDVPYGAAGGDGAYPNAARRQCFDVFNRAGSRHTDAASAGGQAEGCDIVFLLAAIFRGYTGAVSLPVLLDRVNALGSSYPLASGFSSRFAPDQHDGNGSYVSMRFTDSCSCMQYTGRPQPMPR